MVPRDISNHFTSITTGQLHVYSVINIIAIYDLPQNAQKFHTRDSLLLKMLNIDRNNYHSASTSSVQKYFVIIKISQFLSIKTRDAYQNNDFMKGFFVIETEHIILIDTFLISFLSPSIKEIMTDTGKMFTAALYAYMGNDLGTFAKVETLD